MRLPLDPRAIVISTNTTNPEVTTSKQKVVAYEGIRVDLLDEIDTLLGRREGGGGVVDESQITDPAMVEDSEEMMLRGLS
jgi:hypothetical protein